MKSRQSPALTYLIIRAAEVQVQRYLLIAGLPLDLVQGHFDRKLAEVRQQMQEPSSPT